MSETLVVWSVSSFSGVARCVFTVVSQPSKTPSLPCLNYLQHLLQFFFNFVSRTDPSSTQTSSEERLNHETQELEKRLSMLSQRSSTGTACCSKKKRGNFQTEVCQIFPSLFALKMYLCYIIIPKHCNLWMQGIQKQQKIYVRVQLSCAWLLIMSADAAFLILVIYCSHFVEHKGERRLRINSFILLFDEGIFN